MSYEQAMKHWRNHRKDRFLQECGGYSGDGIPSGCQITPEREAQISRQTMNRILNAEHDFPIYLAQNNIGGWELVPQNHISCTEIADFDSLKRFASEYA